MFRADGRSRRRSALQDPFEPRAGEARADARGEDGREAFRRVLRDARAAQARVRRGEVGRVELDDGDAEGEEEEREPLGPGEGAAEEEDREDGGREELELVGRLVGRSVEIRERDVLPAGRVGEQRFSVDSAIRVRTRRVFWSAYSAAGMASLTCSDFWFCMRSLSALPACVQYPAFPPFPAAACVRCRASMKSEREALTISAVKTATAGW